MRGKVQQSEARSNKAKQIIHKAVQAPPNKARSSKSEAKCFTKCHKLPVVWFEKVDLILHKHVM